MYKGKQVIIGNSAAGLSAIKAIREVNRCCPITLISGESCNAYSPVLITYYLKDRISREGLFIVDDDFYKSGNVKTIFGHKVTRVEPSKQVVYLDSGEVIGYDNLLIATGASPVRLRDSENEPGNVFSVRTIEDADRIVQRAKRAREVIVIGAGLIGLQVADALSGKEIKLTMIEWADQVFPETADPDCAAIVQKEIESYGISIHLGERVKEIKQRGDKTVVISGLGEELSADMVITGIGVTPNVQLISGSGIEVNRGIVVDGMMRTNISNVFAAGDVSEGENLATGKNEILPNWSNACKQGRIAGLNMAGYEQRYEGGLRETITSIFGLILVAIGLVHAPKNNVVEEISFVELQRKTYRKVLVAGDRMVGAVLLGKIEDAGIIKSFIRNKKKVSRWKEGIARSPLDMRKVLLSVTGEYNTYHFK